MAKLLGKYYKRKSMGRKVKKLYKKRIPRKLGGLVSLIKKVSLAKTETKNTHQIVEDTDIYHNLQTLTTNLLYTRQGQGDNNTGTSSYSMRIGDEVVARGLQIKMWFANVDDRPNVMYKIIIFKYYSQSTPPTTIFKSQGSSNIMIRDIDTEKVKIIKVKQFNLQVGASFVPPTANIAGSFSRKEAHRYLKFYIPLYNKKIRYIADDSGTPRDFDIGFCVTAYDSYGTLQTDVVGTFAYNAKFYFKDP